MFADILQSPEAASIFGNGNPKFRDSGKLHLRIEKREEEGERERESGVAGDGRGSRGFAYTLRRVVFQRNTVKIKKRLKAICLCNIVHVQAYEDII